MGLLRLLRRWRQGEERHDHSADWRHFAPHLRGERVMTVTVTDRYAVKQGRSTGRLVLQRQGKKLVVYLKRHREAPLWRRLLALIWPGCSWSPAFVEWRHLHWAREHGVPIPTPVAVGEFIGPGLRLESYLAVEELTDMLPLHQAVPRAATKLRQRRFQKWKRSVSAQLARHARTLHSRRHFHKDLYLCHFFVSLVPEQSSSDSPLAPTVREGFSTPASHPSLTVGASSRGCLAKAADQAPHEAPVYMIDLHRLAYHPLTAWRWRIKDLAELLFSSDVTGVTDRDRLKFLHQYLGRKKLDRPGRRLLHRILIKAGRYRRQNVRSQEPGVGNQGSRIRGRESGVENQGSKTDSARNLKSRTR